MIFAVICLKILRKIPRQLRILNLLMVAHFPALLISSLVTYLPPFNEQHIPPIFPPSCTVFSYQQLKFSLVRFEDNKQVIEKKTGIKF